MARETRFRKPDFQEKLARARAYERRIGGSRLPKYILLVAVLAALYYLSISPRFLVVDPSINENGPSREQVQSVLVRLQGRRVWYIIPSNHILVLNKEDLSSELRADNPKVRGITMMKKTWPNRLALNIEMREPRYVWQSGANFYLLDQDGVIFEQIPGYTPEAFSQSLIVDSSEAAVEQGAVLAIQPVIKFIEDIRGEWAGKIKETNVVSFSIPAARSKEIIVKTGIGFSIYFDLERSVSEQLSDLRMILREQIRPETYIGLSYIDLRLPATAYYCYKDAPCAPEYSTTTPSVAN